MRFFANGPAVGQTLNQFVGFGDSRIDSGHYRALASAGAGKPTSGPGVVSSEALAAIVAPSYWMAALVLGKDWGMATVGTTATFAPGITAYATFSGQIAQQNVVTHGGQIGVNVALQ